MGKFEAIKAWQIGVLVGILALAAAGTFGFVAIMGESGEASLSDDEQLIPVQLGNLVNEVSVNGSVLFPNRETLVFGSFGTIAEILVEEGRRVGQGEPLANFDAETIAELDKAVASSRVNLRDAEETLVEFQTISELELAKSESAVSSAKMGLANAADALDQFQNVPGVQMWQAESLVSGAKLSFDNAEDALSAILAGPTAQELASAGAKVSTARLAFEKAEDSLAVVQDSPTAQELAQSEAIVTEAQLDERTKQEAFAEFKAGPTEDDISDSRNAVSTNDIQVANAQADLTVVKTEWSNRIDTAESDLLTKTDDYINEFKTWLGIELDFSQLDSDASVTLAALGVDLDTVFGSESQFGDLVQGGYYSEGLPADDPSTSWNESTVFTWQNFSPAQIVGSCDANSIPFQSVGFCVSHEFDTSASAYKLSKDNLESLNAQSAKAIASAEASVDKAQDGLKTAQDTLEDILDPIDTLSLDDKQRDMDVASASLRKALDDLAVLKSGPTQAEIDNQNAQVELTKSNLDQAIEDMTELKAGADLATIDNQRNQVELAKATLSDVQDELATLLNGADPVELETKLLEVEVARFNLADREQDLADLMRGPDILDLAVVSANRISAQAALREAEERLVNSVITAPWDGVITIVNAEAGDTINPNTPIFEIVDTSVVEIDGVVDEIDVLFVRLGSSALVTMDALPGELLSGEVSFIALEPDTQQGVVSFPIRISISLPPGIEVPEGLSAVANIVIREDRGVLLVPINSLYGSFDQPTVRVVKDGQVLDRPVVLGNSDDFWIVVDDGISEGDLVVMESQGPQSNQFDFGAAFNRRFSGGVTGFPGGGFGGAGGGRNQRRPR
ncbi:MAG: efflux RND transporter periplasmic adaptor subunit [Chloroflexi bacterium]|nr:efflux RND transporter periplasmic adaptor subunit [Chloroflexota bacterium]